MLLQKFPLGVDAGQTTENDGSPWLVKDGKTISSFSAR
jgi:hypothetical protein